MCVRANMQQQVPCIDSLICTLLRISLNSYMLKVLKSNSVKISILPRLSQDSKKLYCPGTNHIFLKLNINNVSILDVGLVTFSYRSNFDLKDLLYLKI